MDFLLSAALRRATPLELSRARVVGGTALFFVLTGVLFVPYGFLTMPNPWSLAALGLANVLGVAGSLVLLRRASSARPAAMALCAAMALSYLPINLLTNDPTAGVHAVSMLLPLLSVYLLGARVGLIITAFFSLCSLVIFPFYFADTAADFPRFWGSHAFAALAILGGWAIGRLSSAARDEAQLALEQTLKELRESQRQMTSLIESTDDLVFSVDTQGQLLIFNKPARLMLQQRSGEQEPRRGTPFTAQLAPEAQARWRERVEQVLAGQSLAVEEILSTPQGSRVLSISLHPLQGEDGRPAGATVFARDITVRTEAEAKLAEMHRTLVDVSRQAGMAEVAIGVLHNVGNTLNSVNISASLLGEMLRKSRVTGLARASSLMKEHAAELGAFLTSDARGRQLPHYLSTVSEELLMERDRQLEELQRLTESVEHVKGIVSTQQAHARMGGVVEQVPVVQLLNAALRLKAASFEQLSIQVRREFQAVPSIQVDRHKLLQILVNLLSNARHALMAGGREDKVLTLRVGPGATQDRIRIQVSDNGVGIPPENLTRIFSQGFTTKKTGHGLGLHISALAAAELGGTLTCSSAGSGQGATFTLELPVNGYEARA
ncbi:MAG: PAS domain-containing protein [Myxococcaceae bacterium]|nr:PAS domain-containing protein [Myxococcaceae bacterium]